MHALFSFLLLISRYVRKLIMLHFIKKDVQSLRGIQIFLRLSMLVLASSFRFALMKGWNTEGVMNAFLRLSTSCGAWKVRCGCFPSRPHLDGWNKSVKRPRRTTDGNECVRTMHWSDIWMRARKHFNTHCVYSNDIQRSIPNLKCDQTSKITFRVSVDSFTYYIIINL